MIDALTINFILIILSLIYFSMALTIYFVRKQKYLLYYSLTFVTLTFVYLLLFLQQNFPDWISFILMNSLLVISQIFVVIGVRSLYKQKPFVPRFLILFVVLVLLMTYYTYFDFNINARIIVISIGVSLYLLDNLLFVYRHSNEVIPTINKSIKIITVISAINWLSRIFFALYRNVEVKYLVDQGSTTSIYYIIALISMSVWFALYILLETSQSVYDLRQKNEELSKLALIDNLTQLANRHYFDHDIEFLIAISNRNKSKLSMLMVDLDRFKLVNDTFGHLVGDDVLRRAAQILRESVRLSDRIYRWGGEEFVIVIPETDNAQAGVVAEKICQNFRKAQFDVIGNITVSIGVASYDKDEPIEAWFKRVDLALYQAKQTGRNRWVSWLDDESLPEHFVRFNWSSDFESGNQEIDNDHKLLAMYVNNLHDLVINHYPIDTIHESINKMSEHIKTHFMREEYIISRFGFEDLNNHRSIHQRLLGEYEIILKKTINGDISLAAFMSFLVEKVLIHHILDDDKKFFDILKKG